MRARGKRGIGRACVAGVAGLVVLTVLGLLMFSGGENAAVRTVPGLSVAAYLDSANSLRGNTYKLEGVVANVLVWTPGSGRLISVDSSGEVLPVIVTNEFNSMNIQKGQKLVFVLAVNENGLLTTKKILQK